MLFSLFTQQRFLFFSLQCEETLQFLSALKEGVYAVIQFVFWSFFLSTKSAVFQREHQTPVSQKSTLSDESLCSFAVKPAISEECLKAVSLLVSADMYINMTFI